MNKPQNRKLHQGFTVAELLIVVAIIAVLVAIAIPLFRTQLEKSREAADIHTMRTVASAGQQFYYEGVHDEASARAAGMGWWGTEGDTGANAFAIYNPADGKFYDSWNDFLKHSKAYGKGTEVNGGTVFEDGRGVNVYKPRVDYTDAACQVSIFPYKPRKEIQVQWKKADKNSRPFRGDPYIIYLE